MCITVIHIEESSGVSIVCNRMIIDTPFYNLLIIIKVNRMKRNIDSQVWLAVKWDIESDIITGVYKAGDKLPTVVELMEKYNVSRATIQRITAALNDENIVMSKETKGIFVKPFVRERLLKKHKKYLQQQCAELVKQAERIGLSLKDISEMTGDEEEELLHHEFI